MYIIKLVLQANTGIVNAVNGLSVLEDYVFHSFVYNILLGVPVQESVDGQLSTIEVNWSLAELNHFVCQRFPMISLNLVEFELAKVDKGKKIKKVQANSVRALKKVMGKSRFYIVPCAEGGQVQCSFYSLYLRPSA